MKKLIYSITGICLLSSCSYTSYEYITNKSGKEVEVIISPALPDSIYRIKANHFEKQGVTASVSNNGNEGKYIIKNKGYLRLGLAFDNLDKDDFNFNYVYINKGNGDTLFYETVNALVPEFKQTSFTPSKFVKEPKKKTSTQSKKKKKGSDKIGGWVYTIKKPKIKK